MGLELKMTCSGKSKKAWGLELSMQGEKRKNDLECWAELRSPRDVEPTKGSLHVIPPKLRAITITVLTAERNSLRASDGLDTALSTTQNLIYSLSLMNGNTRHRETSPMSHNS